MDKRERVGPCKLNWGVAILILIILTFSIGGQDLGNLNQEIKVNGMETVKVNYYKNPESINYIGDPYILKTEDNKYYCYATSGGFGFNAWVSDNLEDWKNVGEVYKTQHNSWGYKDFWAPEVIENNGKYYMYYSARWEKNNSLRIGVAVSDSPKGPFKDIQNKPLFDFGYATIDADVFIDEDGKKYLYFSRDCSENIVESKHESQIFAIELNDDMLSVKGEPKLLLTPDQAWEKQSGTGTLWNEAPFLIKHDKKYYLMYSANLYSSKYYSVGYAVGDSPLGPFTKYANNPILSSEISGDSVSGPGHNSVTYSPDNKELFIIYHTHMNTKLGGGDRQLAMDRMGFREDGTIYVNGPTLSPQPNPTSSIGYYNISQEAKVEVSSLKNGFRQSALVDGEIGLYNRFEKNEWTSSIKDEKPSIKLSWGENKHIYSVVIYGSSLKEKNDFTFSVLLGDGQKIENLKFSGDPGEALILNFDDSGTNSFTLQVTSKGISKEVGISEIMVFGK